MRITGFGSAAASDFSDGQARKRDADETVAGNQAFTFIGTAAITGPGQISYFTTATDTYILFGTDADVFQEMTIRLTGVYNVDASWFVL